MKSAVTEKAVGDHAVTITLPDGSARTFARGVTGQGVAAAIGPGLAKAALVMVVDGAHWDLARELPDGAAVRFIRAEEEAALPVLRHDCAHVMAEAVQDLFPGTQVTIGPPIEDGFYYDFARNEPFHPEDLARIEARMAEVRARHEKAGRKVSKEKIPW